MSDYPYKIKIEECVMEWPELFSAAEPRAREFHLGNRCRADFCFRIKPNGYLFIEDDDGVRGLSNLVKYWMWCLEKPERPVHFIHILEQSRSAELAKIAFIVDKMHDSLSGFQYHEIFIKNWQVSDELWLPELRKHLKYIVESIQTDLYE